MCWSAWLGPLGTVYYKMALEATFEADRRWALLLARGSWLVASAIWP